MTRKVPSGLGLINAGDTNSPSSSKETWSTPFESN